MNMCCPCNRSCYGCPSHMNRLRAMSAEDRVLMRLGSENDHMLKEITKYPVPSLLFKLLVEDEEQRIMRGGF